DAARLRTIAPDSFLGPAELIEFAGPQRRLSDCEKLVELRRRHPRAGEHGMRLAAMMDLMLEQMHQETIAPFGLHRNVAIDSHDVVETFRRQRITENDQSLVNGGLGRL